MAVRVKHPHYHKNVAHLTHIDVYRVLERFGVTDPTIQHAVKKLLVSGRRGAGKDQFQDVNEAIDSLNRYVEMYHENAAEELVEQSPAGEFVRQTVNINVGKPVFDGITCEQARRLAAKASEDFRREVVRSTPVNRKKMSETTKRELSARKAAKRPAARKRSSR